MSIGIVVGSLIVLAVIVWALQPLWESRRARQAVQERAEDEAMENLLFERESLLASLRDMRLDHEMGKLSDEDFTSLDAHYRARAVAVLKQLDELGVTEPGSEADSLDEWIERAVMEQRRGSGYSSDDRTKVRVIPSADPLTPEY